MSTPRSRRIRKRVILSLLAVSILGLTGFLIWCSILYEATPAEFADVTGDPSITITDSPEALVLAPTDDADGTGLLFVPGAKVQAEAHAYTLSSLVDDGTTVVISKPILNLAFFDPRPMKTFTDLAPDVTSWYVGGHSLGGVKACQFPEGRQVVGLVLLGSYCANDLSDDDLAVISIGGSEDGLSTREKIGAAAGLLPADTEFVEIAGSNHAQFGDYGLQPGDGMATITHEEARSRISELLVEFVD